ncbi:hypothetical protein FMEXI_12264 [Fusarium mexicanum]|uniref:Uncharacterized protein n=1 Tax=Fusarium mexicanum TaxID=751941 RepID=A0A8H5I8S8_9HYPO|nr:hypothetical protein FMEXI_12264 [Fusarium mexicanum]
MSTQQGSASPDVDQQSQVSSPGEQRPQDAFRECQVQLEDLLSKLDDARSEAHDDGRLAFQVLALLQTMLETLRKNHRDLKKANEKLKQTHNQLISDVKHLEDQFR